MEQWCGVRWCAALLLCIVSLVAMGNALEVSCTWRNGTDGILELGPLPAAVRAGVTYAGYSSTVLASNETRAEIEEMSERNVRWVSLVVTWKQEHLFSSTIYPDSSETATMESTREAIAELHARNISVLLKPHVDVDSGLPRSLILPKNTTEWFQSYSAMLLDYAAVAEQLQVEALCIGTELSLLSLLYPEQWEAVIADVRAAYSGSLTYAAIFFVEYRHVQFWQALDWVGIDAYWSLEPFLAGRDEHGATATWDATRPELLHLLASAEPLNGVAAVRVSHLLLLAAVDGVGVSEMESLVGQAVPLLQVLGPVTRLQLEEYGIGEDYVPPTLCQMAERWQGHMQSLRRWREGPGTGGGMPVVFTEVGYVSDMYCAVFPVSYPRGECGSGPLSAPYNTTQRQAYEALFSAVASNADMLEGFFLWWWDNPSTSDYYPTGQQWPCYYTPRGKPALAAMSRAMAMP